MKIVLITLTIVIFVFVLYACKSYTKVDAYERTLKETVITTKMEDGSYTLQFSEPDTYKIYVGEEQDKINWEEPIAVVEDSMYQSPSYPFTNRYFFGVLNSNGDKMITSERLIPMEGAVNFRDLGGIPTNDGRAIKWGKIYRSGKLNTLSERDRAYFDELHIKTVADFRNSKEIKEDPSRYPDTYEINTAHIPIGDDSGNVQAELKRTILSADPEEFDGTVFVAGVMRDFVDSFAYQYQPFIDLMLDADTPPMLYHCSAGKDRTGFATAVVLSILGVEKDTIMGEYLMSNYYRHGKINKTLRKMTLVGVDQRVAQPLVEIQAGYLQAAFDVINDKYGSMKGFLEQEYGLTEEKMEMIRDRYLTAEDENAEVVKSEDIAKEENIVKEE